MFAKWRPICPGLNVLRCLISLATQQFVLGFIQAANKENIKTLY